MGQKHVDWVEETAKKMDSSGNIDIETWDKFWVDAYKNVFNKSQETATAEKGCPRKAAYAIWLLGQLTCSNRQKIRLTETLVPRIANDLGKNAAYAVIAIIFVNNHGKEHSFQSIWQRVKSDFRRIVGQEPAESDQGPVELVISLSEYGRLK